MTDSIFARNDIDELEKRLVKMDVKLRTAKKTRDEYVNFLRQKYARSRLSKMHIYRQPLTSNQFRRSVLDSLTTNKYHWDLGKCLIVPDSEPELGNLEPSDPIPSSGPALEGDLVRIKKRLGEIAEDLESLREHRLHLSTAEYYLSLGPEFCIAKSQEMPWKRKEKEPNVSQLKNLHELRRQIKQIDACTLLDTPRPDAESHEWIRMEYLQKYSNSAIGRNDNQNKRMLKQPFTEKEKNSSMPSTEHQKESSYFQEAQWSEANTTMAETFDFNRMLNMQRDDQKSSSLEMTDTMVSRPTEIGSTAQASHIRTAADDGSSFLTKILGSSVDCLATKTAFTDRLTDGILKTVDSNAEDSDSNFFT
ncbi:Secreted RxLR effector protein [Dirofilaria immitis]